MFARPDGTFFALTLEFTPVTSATAELFSLLHWNFGFITPANLAFWSRKTFFRTYVGISPFFRTYTGIFRVSSFGSNAFLFANLFQSPQYVVVL